jgi:hypothetical protein
VIAPVGTVTVSAAGVQLVTVAVTPLNVTVLVDWIDPKFEPAKTTEAPTIAPLGVTLVTEGVSTPVTGVTETLSKTAG